MPLDWSAYDDFDWAGSQQSPLDAAGRLALEEEIADLLGLSAGDRQTAWGSASPPGRYAATVVRLGEVEHKFAGLARARGVSAVGIKAFKTTPDARREAAKLVPFHRDALARLPGLPSPHVQRSLTAERGRAGRAFVVQEWVAGDGLEGLVRRRWPRGPLEAGRARSLLHQLLAGLVVPLWSAGTVWWDVRDANFVYDEAADRLVMIDVDSLAAYADEALEKPHDWSARRKGLETALPRLRQMTVRLLLAQGLRPKARAEAGARAAWEEEMGPALRAVGAAGGAEAGLGAVGRYLGRLGEVGLFREGLRG